MQTIEISKTVRYATYGNPKKAKNIWIALHGYGQLPEYFIRKFQHLNPEENYVVAPEGMHRFYLNGTSGRVGASWMTKEARENDITDNMAYLDKLWNELNSHGSFKHKILLGFSQGGATAARWHELGNFNASKFVLWASVFPPDLSFKANSNSFDTSNNFFVLGNEDPYYSDDNAKEIIKETKKLDFMIYSFDGKHELDKSVLDQIESKNF